MRVLFAKCFGIGNAIMAVPAIKAISEAGHEVDVLIGNTSDDGGTLDVFTMLMDYLGSIKHIWVNSVPQDMGTYDVAVLSIPFDGRWKNGQHFRAASVIDGRTRPDPSTTGLVSWKKHEIEYQMDNARMLGYKGQTPSCSFMYPEEWALRPRVFYLGVGYKKDSAGFWKVKHWGNENYAELVKRILAENPMNLVYTSGDMADLQLSINPISRLVQDKRFQYVPGNLRDSFKLVARCGTYFGNDTGMMHVAASCGSKVVALFMLPNSVTKSRPWCESYSCVEGLDLQDRPRTISVEEVFSEIMEMQSELC